MSSQRVRVGTHYTYEPVGMDQWASTARGVAPGDEVVVVNMPGCPTANTMGHCYIKRADTGAFAGLVLTNSLRRANVR